jgi:hypothetical protein
VSGMDVGMRGLEKNFVHMTTAYLFHRRQVDVEMGAESVERIPSIFKISRAWRGGLRT